MKNFRNLLSNEKGVSLIEVTAAAAISVIISLGIMKTNETGQKGLNKVVSDIDLRTWQQTELMPLLSDSDACMEMLSSYPGQQVGATRNNLVIEGVTRDSFGKVSGKNGKRIAEIGKTIGAHLKITAVSQIAYDDSDGGTVGDCPLKIDIEKNNNDSSFGANKRTITIPIKCRVADLTDKRLLSCQASGGVQDSLWAHAYEASPEYISSDRNVLVGVTATPNLAKFQVKGAVTSNWVNSGMDTAIMIEDKEAGLLIGPDIMIVEDSNNCMQIYNGANGDPNSVMSSCINVSEGSIVTNLMSSAILMENSGTAVTIGSRSSRIDSGTNNSVMIMGNNSRISGSQSTLLIGAFNKIDGDNSQVIGDHLTGNNNNSMIMGSGTGFPGGQADTTSDFQFTGAYQNGYRFMIGASNSGLNTYLSNTPNASFTDSSFAANAGDGVLATEGHVWVGKNTVIEGDLEVKGKIIGLSADRVYGVVSLSGGSGSSADITCTAWPLKTSITDCKCNDPDYFMSSGGGQAQFLSTWGSTGALSSNGPKGTDEWRIECARFSDNVNESCGSFRGVCTKK